MHLSPTSKLGYLSFNVSLTTAYANLNLEGLSVYIVFLIFRPDPCYDMLPLNFK